MFLSEDELKELSGYSRPTAIKRWLDDRGYRYEIARDGWPKVLRDMVYARLNSPQRIPRLHRA